MPVGATGERCTKGYSVMLGDWDDDASTQESIRYGEIEEFLFGRSLAPPLSQDKPCASH